MIRGHAFFGVFNRTLNPIVKAVLRSPVHRLAGRNLALITVTGRRSAREFTFPVGYREDGDRILIRVGAPERKRWWWNLSEPARVWVRIDGVERVGRGVARGDETTGVTVEVTLEAF